MLYMSLPAFNRVHYYCCILITSCTIGIYITTCYYAYSATPVFKIKQESKGLIAQICVVIS